MSRLTATFPYDELDETIGLITLKPVKDIEIVALSLARGAHERVKSALKTRADLSLPAPGQWSSFPQGRALWTAPDQYFVFFDGEIAENPEILDLSRRADVYLTDQTDGWATLEIAGETVHTVLERFVALDLQIQPLGFGTRTSAHHHPVIVMKTEENAYHLLTPRSYAWSFLDALIQTAKSVALSTP